MNDCSVVPFFDAEGAKAEFNWQCVQCQIQKMIDEGWREPGRNKGGCYCQIIEKDCPWVLTSQGSNGKNRAAPSSYYFKPYGFDILKKNSTYKIGKSHFLFNMYHPKMNWLPPQHMPERNRFGALVDPETDCWTLAHINGVFWDDSKINLMWLLKSEHGILEPNTRRIKVITSLKEAGIP